MGLELIIKESIKYYIYLGKTRIIFFFQWSDHQEVGGVKHPERLRKNTFFSMNKTNCQEPHETQEKLIIKSLLVMFSSALLSNIKQLEKFM